MAWCVLLWRLVPETGHLFPDTPCPGFGGSAVDLPAIFRADDEPVRFDGMMAFTCVAVVQGQMLIDDGIAGGKGEGLVFSHGEIIEKVSEDMLIDRLIELVAND